MDEALKIAEPAQELLYHCPGEPAPVSSQIHRARLAAGWQICESCAMRHESAVARTATLTNAAVSRFIYRTTWGVRGPWQNAITRDVAAQLMSVVTCELIRQQAVDDSVSLSGEDTAVAAVKPIAVVAGYDGRSASPDIYAGIVSAALRNGVDVVDAGRCTAASIQEICRSHSSACAAVLVTGAGAATAATGFDVFSVQGAPVPIRWQDWNVTVRRTDNSAADLPGQPRLVVHDSLHRLQSAMHAHESAPYPPDLKSESPGTQSVTTLTLPDPSGSGSGPSRRSRSSGRSSVVNSEEQYRLHLNRWFPNISKTRVTCLHANDIVAERLTWLAETHGLELDLVSQSAVSPVVPQLQARVAKIHAHWGIAVAEDDRYATVVNRYGQQLLPTQLADWINESIRSLMPHVTAHVPTDDDRIVLMDAGRPGRADSHEVISDGLAIMGCICRLMQLGNTLPHAR